MVCRDVAMQRLYIKLQRSLVYWEHPIFVSVIANASASRKEEERQAIAKAGIVLSNAKSS
ncbi:MAG: hypothetical protein RMY29_018285 [Nostoc sp. CreGUA01]